jgi:hypothetical protein
MQEKVTWANSDALGNNRQSTCICSTAQELLDPSQHEGWSTM